ncbi:MAG: FAD-dependent oxidoreductase, partial [Bacteroidia bacterium]
METQVLIIGAGPTGLMAANQLMRFGIEFIIVDHKAGPTKESRAIAVTARSLEIYQQLGLVDRVLSQGTQMSSFNIYSGGKRKAEVKIGEIGTGLSEFKYLFAFEQSRNEELLYSNLREHNREVLWKTEFLSLKEHEGHVLTNLKSESADIEIKAQYLIACDGAKSPVRHQLNFNFEGGTYENRFFVADTVLSWGLESDKLILFPSKTNFCGFFPLKGENYY